MGVRFQFEAREKNPKMSKIGETEKYRWFIDYQEQITTACLNYNL